MRFILFIVASLLPWLGQTEGADKKLVFAQVLFRHGARAPAARLTNQSYIRYFPRGLGELTDRGFENSHLLGKFLGKRYVDSGFLDKNMKSKEMYWRSVKLARCLSTASTVGAAMFENEGKHIHVAVVTEEFDENAISLKKGRTLWPNFCNDGNVDFVSIPTVPPNKFNISANAKLLNYDVNGCQREIELIQDRCPTYTLPSDFKSWPDYESFIASCLNYTLPIFEKYPFRYIEAYLNEYKNGIALPQDLADNLQDVMKIYVKVTQWITGTGVHHDPRMMRLKFGNLVNKLIDDMETAWKCHVDGEVCVNGMKKLKAYSTQDWMLTGILDSFGVLMQSVGPDTYPEYNSMIMIELWEVDNVPRVKFYFKKEEVTSVDHPLIDVTQFVRNCSEDFKDGCPLEKLVTCCDNYRERKIGESCLSGRPSMHLLTKSTELKEKKRIRRFAGPE